MKRLVLFLLIFGIYTQGAFADGLNLANTSNGVCIESGHNGANDCNKIFDGIKTTTNYWGITTSTGYVGFTFYTPKKIDRFSLLHTFNNSNFYITNFNFEYKTSTGAWVSLLNISNYLVVNNHEDYFFVNNSGYYNEYRILINSGGISGNYITELELFEGSDTTTAQQYFDWASYLKSDDFFGSLQLIFIYIFNIFLNVFVCFLGAKTGYNLIKKLGKD